MILKAQDTGRQAGPSSRARVAGAILSKMLSGHISRDAAYRVLRALKLIPDEGRADARQAGG